MNGRIMKKDEFVARMLADQQLRREKKKAAEFKAANDLYGYLKDKDLRLAKIRNQNSATKYRRSVKR